MLKLKLQYFGHLMQRTDPLEKTLMLGKIEGRREWDDRGWDGWMVSLTQWTWVWVSSGKWWWTGKPGMLQTMGLQRIRHKQVTELNYLFQVITSWFVQMMRKHIISSLVSVSHFGFRLWALQVHLHLYSYWHDLWMNFYDEFMRNLNQYNEATSLYIKVVGEGF